MQRVGSQVGLLVLAVFLATPMFGQQGPGGNGGAEVRRIPALALVASGWVNEIRGSVANNRLPSEIR